MSHQDQNDIDENIFIPDHKKSQEQITKILKMVGAHKDCETTKEKARRGVEKAFRIFGKYE